MVRSPVGALSLPLPPGLPSGSLITLEMSGAPQPPAATAAIPESGRWTALSQMITTMAKDPAQAPLLRMIPQAGPQLAAALAVMSTAVRSGNIRPVFGEALTRAMEKGERGDMGRQVMAEFQDAADEASQPSREWRALTLPFVNGGTVEAIRLFLRRPPVDEGDIPDAQKAKEGDRFLIDIDFSRLGRVQLDGLVKRNDRLFDLILRTDQPLTLPLRKDIIALFQLAVETIGVKGSVVFQSGGRWLEIARNRSGTRLDT